ncbi:transporter substrate-binding domain-containing protein [Pseudodesulfovibrio thermohalotolerans]|uniref:substrate-binding periplasmic protein n=1 Tax=Pseudodesulfovibrio thermohalotolerans TaxID=2880651 RepID=UPI002442C1AB|nr:transporter substrate-binding domain-containing protein [Pseudodesulfovibrio thermohalotolerans]WFS62020.1 transporter substrate-binding domain-containing protein [Pseudodesulfovibrio thermohalotolerans]
MIPLLILCGLLLLPAPALSGLGKPKALEAYTWLTEEYYPFNYTENGRLRGISVDLLRMVWGELNISPKPVESMPWARAYERVQHEAHTVLFSMARTPEREKLFQWAGPIASVRFVLIARKDRHIHLETLDDLEGLTVGTLRKDVLDALLAKYQDIARIQPVVSMDQNINKLMTNRLDMVAYEETSWYKIAARYGFDPDDFETVYVLRETPVYYAFNPATPTNLVNVFQTALDRVKARPEYPALLDAYLR